MKKLLSLVAAAVILFSCNNAGEKGKFTVNGQLKNVPDQQVYLEELFFGQKDAEVIDTAAIKNGKFVLHGKAAEEGIYRLRVEKLNNGFLFINDIGNINFTADANDTTLNGPSFASAANNSLKQFINTSQGMMKNVQDLFSSLNQFKQGGAAPTDSIVVATQTAFNNAKEAMTKYCFK